MSISPNISEIMKLQKFLSSNTPTKELREQPTKPHKWEILWPLVYILGYFHLAGIYGLYLIYFHAKYWTIVWIFFFNICSMLGTTAGSHRLWSHRSYKAKWPVKLMLMIFQTTAYQNSIYRWVRDHRLHHKYVDTDADPHNRNRGFFFSHIGWIITRKHPEVIEKKATIDLSDLEQDPFVTFQRKWYNYMLLIFTLFLPTMIPYWCWKETLWCAWHANIVKYLINLHSTLTINSVAHMWGIKPFDKSITPTNNWTAAMVTLGEGWHNYHHVFPWDYRANEFGNFSDNVTAAFIDLCAFLGMAYDLKKASPDMIKRRALRNSEGSY